MPPDPSPIESLALEALKQHERATPGPWCYYHPTEFPRDWRISRAGKAGELGPGSRDYIGRFTTSHDPHRSGNGGRALEGPLEADIRIMVHARNREPLLARAVIEGAERERELEAKAAQLQALLESQVHEAVQLRDRDELWCRALTATLDIDQIHAVTSKFNAMRDALNAAPPPPGANRP